MKKNILNLLLFQVGWFLCVYFVASQSEWLAIISLGAVILVHLLIVKNYVNELKIIFTAGLAGLILDTVLINTGVFIPVSDYMTSNIAPVWLIGLWMLFGISLNHSLRWLQQRYLMAAVLGLISAPLAYYAGQRFGALDFSGHESVTGSLLTIGLCWFFMTPLLLAMSKEFHCSQVKGDQV